MVMRGDWTRSNAVDQRCATSEELPICTKPSIHITQRNQDTVGITTTPSAINNMKMFRLKMIRSLKWFEIVEIETGQLEAGKVKYYALPEKTLLIGPNISVFKIR